jgi:NADH:ubiquinone reductase (H+-translocating)
VSAHHRVVIIGAGYAGLMAANRIAGSKVLAGAAQVTVVNPSAEFVERIRLHELAAGSRDSAAVPMDAVLHPDAAAVVGTASRIDPETRRVHFADGRPPLGYDVLLYAPGSASRFAAAGAAEYDLRDMQEAKRLRSRLSQLAPGATVSLVGGGLTGIEAAAEIAERHRQLQVRLVSRGSIGTDLSGAGRRQLRSRLSRLGIELMENVRVQGCSEQEFITSEGEAVPSDCTIWTVGFGSPGLARDSGLPTDPDGRLLVDEALSCAEYPEIFGAGDAVHAPASVAAHLRMSCAAAMPMGAHAAENIIARLSDGESEEFSSGFMVRCVSLGRASGLIQFVTAEDSPRRLAVGGRLGALMKEQVCRMTLSWLRDESVRSGSYRWPGGPRTARTQRAQVR